MRFVSIHAGVLRVRERVTGEGRSIKFERRPIFAFKKPYTSFKTAKGIRIGSKAKTFRRAYPKARRID